MEESIKNTIARAVVVEALSPQDETTLDLDKTQRLGYTLKNLTEQHRRVKMNILLNGREKRQEILARSSTPSAPMPEEACNKMIANLETPYKTGSAIPFVAKHSLVVQTSSIPSDDTSTIRRAGSMNTSAEHTTVIELANHTLAALNAYDEHARKTADYYQKALDRRKSIGGEPAMPAFATDTAEGSRPLDPRLARYQK